MHSKVKIGEMAQVAKAFSQEEVSFYCSKISLDDNLIHYCKEYARDTVFKHPIVPGVMVSSLFGGLLGSELPGNGTIHLGQTLSFKKPVYIGEEVLAIIKVVKIREDKPIITFSCRCYNNDGYVVVEGEAVVKI